MGRSEGAESFGVRVEVAFAPVAGSAVAASAPGSERPWRVAARARSAGLDAIGLVVDFRKLRDMLDETLAELVAFGPEGHAELTVDNPKGRTERAGAVTPAGVAAWILGRLQSLSTGGPYQIVAVEVEAESGVIFEARG